MPEQNCRPAASSTQKSRDLEEEFLVYDPDGDQVHVLNGTAREIYLLCDGNRKPPEIAAVMTECSGATCTCGRYLNTSVSFVKDY